MGSSDVRPEWVAQLAPGGRLLLPLALRGSQLSVALDLGPDGLLRSDSVRGCAFIRLRGIGAAPETVLPVGAGCSMQVPEDARGRAGPRRVVAAALAAPGPVRPAGVPLGPQDVWDGFGLWLALHDPRAVRLLLDDDVRARRRRPGPARAGPGGRDVPDRRRVRRGGAGRPGPRAGAGRAGRRRAPVAARGRGARVRAGRGGAGRAAARPRWPPGTPPAGPGRPGCSWSSRPGRSRSSRGRGRWSRCRAPSSPRLAGRHLSYRPEASCCDQIGN